MTRRYHAYIEHMESVVRAEIMADSHWQAALEAARTTGVAGQWTVINGEPVTVEIVERTEFAIQPKDTP